jgi:hypothetical protein
MVEKAKRMMQQESGWQNSFGDGRAGGIILKTSSDRLERPLWASCGCPGVLMHSSIKEVYYYYEFR